ncbi:MAG: MATE family efflux transporter, partial [Treponemataceae bacterium]|nr:MATE family efflux transporter [Treponemataceae bacterium]
MDAKKIDLFENYAIPKAVANLAIPCLLGCIVMIIYNIADTYFVGLLGSETESAAVSLAAPLLLAFNAITNLFGVGGSSMMSRSLG